MTQICRCVVTFFAWSLKMSSQAEQNNERRWNSVIKNVRGTDAEKTRASDRECSPNHIHVSVSLFSCVTVQYKAQDTGGLALPYVGYRTGGRELSTHATLLIHPRLMDGCFIHVLAWLASWLKFLLLFGPVCAWILNSFVWLPPATNWPN